ncbi:MAG: Fe-Mn family superoxide dismutase [Candidatus Delongbacteria bacterium]|jgi:Fe-Mn family superoxide dismutase|nr:Fe-Mn family superoxide dismutase [Candidatus Delongbacteria bacterium]
MTPDETEPSSELKAAIEKSFGSMDNFYDEFKTAATSQFGSGWAWLIMDSSDKLLITNTPNQDNPLMGTSKQQGYPLLAIDVWEHAYYLQYKNERGSYIDAFMNVIDWDEVSRRYKMAQDGKHYVPGK